MRNVPIAEAVAADVAGLGQKKGLLLPDVHGERWSKVDYDNWRKRRFKKAVEKANEKIAGDTEKANADLADEDKVDPDLIPADLNPYDLRASACSLWYREGVDKATIATWLGHSIPVLESRYARHFKTLDPLDKRTMAQMIEDARA